MGTTITLRTALPPSAVLPHRAPKRQSQSPDSAQCEDNFFLLLAVIIGLFSGLAVVCFRIAIDYTRFWLLGSALASGSGARDLLVPTLAGLVLAFLVVAIFSAGARQRRHPDQVRRLHLRRLHPVQHRHRKIPHVRAGHRQRAIAGSRGPVAADGRGHCVGARTTAAPVAREGAADCARRRRRGSGGGVQLADRGRALRDRRGDRHLERRHFGRGRAGGGIERRGCAAFSRRRAAVSDPAVPHGASARNWWATPCWAWSADYRRWCS